jgi:hypothetical protein
LEKRFSNFLCSKLKFVPYQCLNQRIFFHVEKRNVQQDISLKTIISMLINIRTKMNLLCNLSENMTRRKEKYASASSLDIKSMCIKNVHIQSIVSSLRLLTLLGLIDYKFSKLNYSKMNKMIIAHVKFLHEMPQLE